MYNSRHISLKGDMYMKTIQGKEFDYSDIVLYKLSGNQQKLIVFVDDKEKLEKLKESNDIKDTPVAFLINTSDEEKNIITKMKQIKSVDVVNGALQVKYEDGSEILCRDSLRYIPFRGGQNPVPRLVH